MPEIREVTGGELATADSSPASDKRCSAEAAPGLDGVDQTEAGHNQLGEHWGCLMKVEGRNRTGQPVAALPPATEAMYRGSLEAVS